MLANETADVLAVGSRLAAEARGIGGVQNWQFPAVEDLLAMHVCKRDFGGRHKIQIPVTRDFEQVGLELRQVAGADERSAVDQERRLDFSIPVISGMQIQHEVDERPGESSPETGQTSEARAGDFGRALEVENPERGPKLPVRPRLEVERSRVTMASDFNVVRRARARWHTLMRQIRQLQ